MKMQPVSPDLLPKVIQAMTTHPYFKSVSPRTLQDVATQCVLIHYAPQEVILQQGDRSDAFIMLLRGLAAVRVLVPGVGETFEIDRIKPVEIAGEVDLLLDLPRRTSLVAADQVLVLQFPASMFKALFDAAPAFGHALAQHLARRLVHDGPQIPLPHYELTEIPPAEVLSLLPLGFIERQRVLPVQSQSGQVVVGFVDDLAFTPVGSVIKLLEGTQIVPVRIDAAAFQRVFAVLEKQRAAEQADVQAQAQANAQVQQAPMMPGMPMPGMPQMPAMPGYPGMTMGRPLPSRPVGNVVLTAPKLDPLLKRLVAEGGSDLHLTAGYRPRWRIDGEMREIADAKILGDSQVFDLLEPAMPERNRLQFLEDNDTDFAYSVPDTARFRVNAFRDHNGVCAVLRVIPSKILTMEQLGLPEGVRRMCDHPKGLVLVTGPTGSGKSTTLAAMVDYINRTRRTHIITLEDPIEFLHKSQKALVNQREVGPHTTSFSRALRAALREDPDIVLVGEMRDQETIQLALETANTGHLVFGTLHTSTAISTVDRIIDVFPPEQQSQVRTVVSETLKGVVAQTLLRRKGGGRVAALEVLVGSHAVSNLIREGKNHQIFNIMLTAKNQGNQLLNEQLEKLVNDGKVEYDEALMKSLDKSDLAKRFGKEYFEK
jgi:pilus retraction protein PilT